MRIHFWAAVLCSTFLTGCALFPAHTPEEPSREQRLAENYMAAGISNLVKGDYTSALRDLLEAVKYDKKNAEVWNHLGLAYYGKSEFSLANDAWDKALSLNPNYTDARNNLGAMHMERGQFAAAEKEFKTALKDLIYDKAYQTQYNLALLYLRQGKMLQAEQALKLSVKDNDHYCPAWLSLGRLYKDRGERDRALEAFQKSTLGTCYTSSPESHYEIAQILLRNRDFVNARAKFQEILERFPNSDLAGKAELSLRQISNRDNL